MKFKIAMAADHAGFDLKEHVKTWLASKGYEVLDFGAASKEKCDYPDFASKAAKAVAEGKADRGVLVCGFAWKGARKRACAIFIGRASFKRHP